MDRRRSPEATWTAPRPTSARLLIVSLVVLAWGVVSCGGADDAATPVDGPAPSTDVSQEDEPTSSTVSVLAGCSGADRQVPPAQDGLPGPVAAMRMEILTAATACDFARLNELALAGDIPFTHTDVLVEHYRDMAPGEFWQAAETEGTGVIALLIHDLSQPFEVRQTDGLGTVYVWWDPAACELLDGVMLCRHVEITEAGDWIAFYGESA